MTDSQIREDSHLLEFLLLGPIRALHQAQKHSVFETINIIKELQKNEELLQIPSSQKENNDEKISLLPIIPSSFLNIDEATLDYKIRINDIQKDEGGKESHHKLFCKMSDVDNANVSINIKVRRSTISSLNYIYQNNGGEESSDQSI